MASRECQMVLFFHLFLRTSWYVTGWYQQVRSQNQNAAVQIDGVHFSCVDRRIYKFIKFKYKKIYNLMMFVSFLLDILNKRNKNRFFFNLGKVFR